MLAFVLKGPVTGLVFVCLLLLAPPGAAEIVPMAAPNGRLATAEYQPGGAGLPAVMVIHGFLQTRDFATVAALADTLAGAGYTVLRPTLTLNVSSRRRSLPCEAVHTHTFEMEVDEVGAWTEWLSRRGHRVVVLVGHSSGAAAILPHLPRPHPAVGGAFLIGLPDPDRQMPDAEHRRLVRDLARLIADAGYRLVAEGIESAEMLEAVKAAGFHKAQGFHLGAPAPPP